MIERVRNACSVRGVDRVLVATDDERIADTVTAAGGQAVITGPAPCGTHRVWDAVQQTGESPDLIVNVQGDLPLLPPIAVEMVIAVLRAGAGIATLAAPWPPDVPISDPAVVKVQVNDKGRAIRFTRAPIEAWRHIGIYGFRRDELRRAIATDRSCTAAEDLEQLAWLHAGLPIDVAVIAGAGPSVDTPEQLEHVRSMLADPLYPLADL